MAGKDTRRRFSDDDWHAHVQSHLARVDALIGEAQARIVEHAAHMAKLEKSAIPHLHAVSQQLHHNLEEGLRLLLYQRDILARELAYIERREYVALGAPFQS
jgi:hypothetical protein